MKSIFAEPIYFIAAKRNPFGTYLGSLAHLSATELGAHAAKAALASISLSPELIDHVIFGNVLQAAKDAIYLARHVGLRSEIPETVPALGVNRLCGSGFEAIIQGARLIALKEAQCVLAGGTENLSQAPHIIRNARRGLSLGQGQLEDSLWECLNDTFINMPMALTAELLAQKYQISQEEVDNYCVLSQQRYQEALKNKIFEDEISAIECGSQKKPKTLYHDEHARSDTSIEILKNLPKVFKKNGVIHAAAASGICDGAAALILCSASFAEAHKIKPLGELLSYSVTGLDPKLMGLGPVSAINNCVKKVNLSIKDMAMIEINEAFAPQVLAVKRDLGLNDQFNIHGGALAIGHPLGASGARITTHLLQTLKHKKGALGIGSACIGGGQGIALMVRSL